MITIEQIKPGMTIMYEGKETTVLQGSYEDPSLGLMIKTSKFPGGYPQDKYELSGEIQTAEVIAPVTFELALIDEVEPVKITAELIRQKVKPLTDLKIASIFDDKGYAEVKKAVTKTVKLRTSVEAQEKALLKEYKTTYDTKKKEVTDYTDELYKACREAQTALEAKLTTIDNEKKIAADKLANEEKERTEGREAKMYEAGLTFNGQAFVGYGKVITKNSLHSLGQEAFDGLVTELEVLQLEQGVTGEVKATPEHNIGGAGSSFTVRPASSFDAIDEVKYPTALYEKEYNGIRFVLTKGVIDSPEPTAVVINDRVAESGVYVQVIDYTK